MLLMCGCSIRIDGTKYSCVELQILANNAKNGGGMLIISNAKKIKIDDLAKIAILGKNNVTFDFGL